RRPAGRAALVAGSVILWELSLLVGLEMALADWRGNFAEWMGHPTGWAALHPLTLAAVVILGLLAAARERGLENSPDFAIGLLVGEITVLATVALTALVLRLALPDEAAAVAPVIFVA